MLRCALFLASVLLWPAAPARAADNAADLVERGFVAMRADPEQSRALAEQALTLMAAQPDPDLTVRAHLLLCNYHSERDRTTAELHVQQARARFAGLKRAALRAAVLGCEGEIHEAAGENAQAMALYQRAVSLAEDMHDDEMLAGALYLRGYLRGVQGEFANGLVDLRRAITLYERQGLAPQTQTALNGIAILYNRMGDHAQARHYYEASLNVLRESGQRRERAVTLHNLGRAQEALQDWGAAEQSFQAQLTLAREIGYSRGEAYALRGLASVLNARGAHAKALSLLAEATSRDAPDERLRAQIMLQRGIALRGLRRPNESVAALQDALEIFRKAASAAETALTHGELSKALADLQDWRGALEHQQQFKAASDALLQRQLDQRFATLKVEFDTAAKDKENALLLREKAATLHALEQAQLASRLQAVVLALATALAALLATLAWRHRRASRRMQQLALTDELTGLPNRRHALSRLGALLAAPPGRCAVLIADIDHFKAINDQYGHLVGDEVLRAVGTALRNQAGSEGLIARLGGEEFVAVLPDASLADAQRHAERLRADVAALDVSHCLPRERPLTVSVGVTAAVPGDSVGSMLKRADDALYAAKAGGRNRTVAQAGLHAA